MNKLLSILGLLFILAVSVHSQVERRDLDVRIDRSKPTVFLIYERTGQREPLHEGESKEGVWLRFKNNTKWKLLIRTGGVPDESYGDAVLFYEIERIDGLGQIPIGYRSHVASVTQLKPGASLVFSMPLEHLDKGLRILIRYHYEWELWNQDAFVRPEEPEHFVTFDSSRLRSTKKQ